MFIKAPLDVLDYEWDWSVWLNTGDTIASVAVAAQTGITLANLPAPTILTAVASTTGGTLAAGTYFYKAIAFNALGTTTGSNEISVTTTGSTSSVALTMLGVNGAAGYRWYRGTSAGNENTYYTVSGMTAVTFTDTGATGTAGAVPVSNTAIGEGFSPTAAYAWISGGTVGQTYTVTCQITTTEGRVTQNTQNLNVLNL